jgi:Uma2 family endonuclease
MHGENIGEWGQPLAAYEGEMHSRDMSDEPPRREATYEDLEKLPPNVIGELIGGELYASPRPASPHNRAASQLLFEVIGAFDRGLSGPGGWLILSEQELHLGRDVLVPDLAGWRRERMPEMPHTVGFTVAPDWVCEVLSPSTERLDRARKMGVYAREAVGHLWLVNPVLRMLEVYRLEGGRWVVLGTYADAETVRAEPFEALALNLGALWTR